MATRRPRGQASSAASHVRQRPSISRARRAATAPPLSHNAASSAASPGSRLLISVTSSSHRRPAKVHSSARARSGPGPSSRYAPPLRHGVAAREGCGAVGKGCAPHAHAQRTVQKPQTRAQARTRLRACSKAARSGGAAHRDASKRTRTLGQARVRTPTRASIGRLARALPAQSQPPADPHPPHPATRPSRARECGRDESRAPA